MGHRASIWRQILLLIATTAITGLVPTFAADTGLGIRGGTQGVGVEFAYGINQRVAIRGGYYGLSVTESFEEGGIDYDGDLTLGGFGVLADFFPTKGKFHLSAGVFSNDNEIEIVASPTTDQEIGGTLYAPSEIGQLIGEIKFDDTAPYFGIGWGNLSRGKRLGFLLDLGVLAQGSGEARLQATGTGVNQADLDAEAQQIEDDISGYDLWPVISVGLAVRF